MVNLKSRKMFGEIVAPSMLEGLVAGLLCLAAVNLCTVLIAGEYRFTIGPFSTSARHLRNPLLLLIMLIMLKIWLRDTRMGMSATATLRSPGLLFLGVVFIYSLNGTTAWAGDTFPARYLPLSLLQEFDFDLDEFPFLYEPQMPYFLQSINGRIISAYPPWPAVLALPVYLVPTLGGLIPQSHRLPELEKISATLITALSVVILFHTLRRLTQERIAWIISVVYAMGTSSLSTSSQALWQHGPSQLFLSITLYALVRAREGVKYAAYAGCALAMAVNCRPVNILIALPIVAYMLSKRRHQCVAFLLASLPPFLMFAAYNTRYFGSPFTTGFIASAFSPASFLRASPHIFSTPLLEGLTGILVSPARGLLIYSPIFVVSCIGMVMVWRESGHLLVKYLCLAPFLSLIVAAKWANWWGGHSYGPRLMADLTPILCLYLYQPFERSAGRRVLKLVLFGLCGLSVSAHALGAFGDGSWNYTPLNVDHARERLWSWVDSPPVYYAKQLITKVGQAYTHLKKIVVELPTSLGAPRQLGCSSELIQTYADRGHMRSAGVRRQWREWPPVKLVILG
jgi:Dolichyl-phosphate-mannose-protein mannosyltransferase